MTDLEEVEAITTTPSSSLGEVEHMMKEKKIKLLFVTDAEENFIGLITNNDVHGERPIVFQKRYGISRNEIRVLDIMTAVENIDVIDWEQVQTSQVGNVVATMKSLHRQHALVIDNTDPNTPKIRGIFSITKLSQLLGLKFEANEPEKTFAELDKILGI